LVRNPLSLKRLVYLDGQQEVARVLFNTVVADGPP
jgi:hypothetical protein